MSTTQLCQVEVQQLNELIQLIPADCKQFAAVKTDGVWVVSYIASIIPEKKTA